MDHITRGITSVPTLDNSAYNDVPGSVGNMNVTSLTLTISSGVRRPPRPARGHLVGDVGFSAARRRGLRGHFGAVHNLAMGAGPKPAPRG